MKLHKNSLVKISHLPLKKKKKNPEQAEFFSFFCVTFAFLRFKIFTFNFVTICTT